MNQVACLRSEISTDFCDKSFLHRLIRRKTRGAQYILIQIMQHRGELTTPGPALALHDANNHTNGASGNYAGIIRAP